LRRSAQDLSFLLLFEFRSKKWGWRST
jgi:hypothetical protein